MKFISIAIFSSIQNVDKNRDRRHPQSLFPKLISLFDLQIIQPHTMVFTVVFKSRIDFYTGIGRNTANLHLMGRIAIGILQPLPDHFIHKHVTQSHRGTVAADNSVGRGLACHAHDRRSGLPPPRNIR